MDHRNGVNTSFGEDTKCLSLSEMDHRNGVNTSFGEDTKCLALSEMEPVRLGWLALSVCSAPT